MPKWNVAIAGGPLCRQRTVGADYNSKVANLASQEKKIFEPVNLGLSKTKNRALDPVRSTWLPGWDSMLLGAILGAEKASRGLWALSSPAKTKIKK
jgi:hypothetical protein